MRSTPCVIYYCGGFSGALPAFFIQDNAGLILVEQQILDFIRSVYDAIGWPGVVLLMAIESACIPLPSMAGF